MDSGTSAQRCAGSHHGIHHRPWRHRDDLDPDRRCVRGTIGVPEDGTADLARPAFRISAGGRSDQKHRHAGTALPGRAFAAGPHRASGKLELSVGAYGKLLCCGNGSGPAAAEKVRPALPFAGGADRFFQAVYRRPLPYGCAGGGCGRYSDGMAVLPGGRLAAAAKGACAEIKKGRKHLNSEKILNREKGRVSISLS